MWYRILRTNWVLLIAAAVVAGLVLQPAAAKPGDDGKHFGELTKDTEHLTGFFDLYKTKDGTIYLEIPVENLGKDFLLSQSLSRGIGTHGFLGGMPLNYFGAQMLRFEKKNNRIHLIQPNTDFIADDGSPMARAVDLSYGDAVMATFDIESERHEGDEIGVVPEKKEEEKADKPEEKEPEDSDDPEMKDAGAGDTESMETPKATESPESAQVAEADEDAAEEDAEEAEEPEKPVISIVIDFGSFVASDVPNLGVALGESFKGGFKLDRDRTTVESMRVYPKNAEFDVNLVFSSSGKENIDTVPDSRYVPLGVHYSFAELPEDPMMPRLADDRVGYFMTVKKNFSRDDQQDFYVRYINHWRLEKKNPNRELSEPVKPIVYYIENTIPKEYRKYVKEGVEMWQKAFEKAGFKNAIVAMDQPDDPDWEAEDLRYSSIRWITSHHPSFGAIGPSRVDPRTGETLDADILFEASMISSFRHIYRRMAESVAVKENGELEFPWETAQRMETEAFEAAQNNPKGAQASGLYCSMGHGFVESGGLMAAALTLTGKIQPGDPVPIEFVGEALRWAVAHEVGHTLGLRHNFKASMSVPMDKLQDKQYVKENGLYGSVMDYPIVNLADPGQKQGYYYTPSVGTYDVWAIQYGYTPIPNARTPEAEVSKLNAIASLSADPLHAYGTDEDAYMMGSTDPRTGIWDLGADPLGWAEGRTEMLAGLWTDLDDRAVASGQPWTRLTGTYMTLLGQYSRAMTVMSKYIGARYQSRAHRGDPGAGLPFETVPADEQRRALNILASHCFSEQPFDMPEDFYGKLTANNFSHWGSSPAIGGRRDFPFHQAVLSIQRTALGRIMNPVTFAKVLDGELQDPTSLSLVELFSTLNSAIWSEITPTKAHSSAGMGGGTPAVQNISGVRRGLQRDWLKRLVEVSLNEGSSASADARSVARYTLQQLGQDMDRALEQKDELDGYTTAHLMDSRTLVTKALDASYEAEVMSGH